MLTTPSGRQLLRPILALCIAWLLSVPACAEPASRTLLEGAHNFRDLGGYTTADGATVKSGMVFRSDALSTLTEADLDRLEALGIRRVVDFRSTQERDAEPDRLLAEGGIEYVHRPITVEAAAAGRGQRLLSGENTPEDMYRFLTSAYVRFVEDYTPVYREWMHSLLQAENYPAVFHCTAGKDRTGVAAALLLHALGVPMETIYKDFLATNRLTADYVEARVARLHDATGADPEALAVLMTVDRRYLDAAFEAMRAAYGSVDAYMADGLGLREAERQQLRRLLLER